MSNYSSDPFFSFNKNQEQSSGAKVNYFLPIGLFLITFITTTLAGTEWILGFRKFDYRELVIGLPYSLSILFVLASHEFGHYFASKYHGVKATLPYFIPFPPILGFLNFGTLGAVIKTKSPITSKKALFDIGIAGPIAGFVASFILLIYGFTHLPNINYILNIHPDYFEPTYGKNALHLEFGDTLLFVMLREFLTNSSEFVPPMSEIYHYPFLCVGWFGLFVTSMNLIPVGQLDGGHISYAALGTKNHYKIASISMIILIVLGVLGIVQVYANINTYVGWPGWMFWALVLYFVIKIKHPEIPDYSELGKGRKLLAFLSLVIFILCFSPTPFIAY
jgi:membrane-associated protease RseP (regulator of RpoE activity)